MYLEAIDAYKTADGENGGSAEKEPDVAAKARVQADGEHDVLHIERYVGEVDEKEDAEVGYDQVEVVLERRVQRRYRVNERIALDLFPIDRNKMNFSLLLLCFTSC